MAHFEKKLDEKEIYQGRVIDLSRHEVALENGKTALREVIRHPGAVAIVAVDEQDHLLMVRQFRYPVGQELLELPAGKLNPGEDPISRAYRELEEETGYRAASLSPLTRFYPTPAYCDELIHLYYASDLSPSDQCLDEDEFLTLVKIPLTQAIELVKAGQIHDGKTQTGILLYAAMKGLL